MKTKIKNFEEINNSTNNEKIKIPENILNEVNEKWFFVYNWIDENEIKASIELDFLNKMVFLWPIWIWLAILAFFALNIFWVILAIVFFSLLMVLYITFYSIYTTLKASKISHLIITNKYFSINRKFWKIEENHIFLDKSTQKLWEKFREKIFSESNLKQEKSNSSKKIISLVLKWFEFIWERWWNSKDTAKAKMIFTLIYWAFLLAMWVIYFWWIILTLLFWIFINFLIKRYMIWKWHKVLIISEYFKDIENSSKLLKSEKNNLEKNLKEASKNNWQDWLLLKINSGIENVNKNAKISMEENLKLIDEIKNSDFKDIFDYILYNSWLKNQIATPIKWVIEMLEENIKILENEIENTDNTIKNSSDIKANLHLEIAKNRLKMKKSEIEKHLLVMKWYLLKLEI